jgi:hypothetical protein
VLPLVARGPTSPISTDHRYRDDRFSCSLPAPATSSRHLYTGHRQAGMQATSWLRAHWSYAVVPGLNPVPGFDAVVGFLDASAVVHSRSSSRRTPDPLCCGPFPQSLPTPALDRHDTAVVWDLRLHGEPGGPTPITGTARFVLTTFYIAITLLPGHTDSVTPCLVYGPEQRDWDRNPQFRRRS